MPSSVNVAALPDALSPQADNYEAVTVRNTPIHILKDQTAVWMRPVRIRLRDLEWLAPLSAATGASIATDRYVLASVVSHDSSFSTGESALFLCLPIATLNQFALQKELDEIGRR